MSKDNDLNAIKDWLTWHHKMFNIKSVVFMDNKSTKYSLEDLNNFFKTLDFINNYVIVNCNFPYGSIYLTDTRPPYEIDWSYFFLQVGFINIAAWNFLYCSKAVIQCDIDEFFYSKWKNLGLLLNFSPTGVIFSNYSRYMISLKELKKYSFIDYDTFGDKFYQAEKYIFKPKRFNLADEFSVHEIKKYKDNKSFIKLNKFYTNLLNFSFFHLKNINNLREFKPHGTTNIIKEVIKKNNIKEVTFKFFNQK